MGELVAISLAFAKQATKIHNPTAMSSILIFGSTRENRENEVLRILGELELKISENNVNLLFVDLLEKKKSIGIGQIREATKFLNEKPFSHKSKAIVINRAEVLTEEAQNALLKTLEEPPTYATIILNAKTEKSLLDTVISRCKKIDAEKIFKAKDKIEENLDALQIKDVLAKSTGEKLFWAGEISKEEREVVIEILENFIKQLRTDLNTKSAQNIEIIMKVKKDLENTNVSLRLALEYLVLKLQN